MKNHFFVKLIALLGVIVSGVYLVLLLVSQFVSLPFEISDNVLFADWAFIAVPILGQLSAVLLQITAVRK